MEKEKEKIKNECGVRLINLTPHSVTIYGGDNSPILTIESSGVVRLAEQKKRVGEIAGIPIYEKSFGSGDLPEQREGTYYIVSLPVAQAYPERQDLLVPDELVRDKNGRVVGCRCFAKIAKKKVRRQSKYAEKLAKLDRDLREFWQRNGKVCIRVNLSKYVDMSSSYQRRLVKEFLKDKGYEFEILDKYWARVCSPKGGE